MPDLVVTLARRVRDFDASMVQQPADNRGTGFEG